MKVDEFCMELVQCPPDAHTFLFRWRSLRHDLGAKRWQKIYKMHRPPDMYFIELAPKPSKLLVAPESAYRNMRAGAREWLMSG